MNVTPSKILLGLSLTAYTYFSWDHLFDHKSSTAAVAPAKSTALTAAVVNRSVPLKLERDPFNSVPLGQTLASETPLPVEPGKELGNLKLNGVMITFAERAAVVNGKTLHEGETIVTSTGATVRAKKIGVGYCMIEGGGQIVMLRVDEKTKADEANASVGAPGSTGRGSNGATSAAKSPRAPGKK